MNIPDVKPHDWITLGSTDAVICQVFEKSDSFIKAEVVYYDHKKQAIGEEVTWQNGKWEFTSSSGLYADKYPRFNEFISQLHLGRYR